MGAGDLTASTPTFASTPTEVKAAIDALNLSTVTDKIAIVPVSGRDKEFMIFKVEREA